MAIEKNPKRNLITVSEEQAQTFISGAGETAITSEQEQYKKPIDFPFFATARFLNDLDGGPHGSEACSASGVAFCASQHGFRPLADTADRPHFR